MGLEHCEAEQDGVAGHVGDEGVGDAEVAPAVGRARSDCEHQQQGVPLFLFHG